MNNIQLYRSEVLSIEELCKKIAPYPDEVVLFGMAKDDLPILMSVVDSKGKNIVVWDRLVGQGLKLVKTVIEFIMRYKKGKKTEFIILSNHTKEWERLGENGLGVWNENECVAILPFWDKVCDQVLFALAGWCYGRRDTKAPILLFIDGLENLGKLSKDAQHDLTYVMAYGRKRNIYVVGTANSESREELTEWLEGFQAEIFGQTSIEWFEMDENKKSVLFYTPKTTI